MNRFWAQVDRSGDCWLWKGALLHGYGAVRRPGGKMERAHRLAFEMAFGPIPEPLWVLHICNNRQCVNPAHLKLGDHAENVKDAIEEQQRIRKGLPRPAVSPTNGRTFDLQATLNAPFHYCGRSPNRGWLRDLTAMGIGEGDLQRLYRLVGDFRALERLVFQDLGVRVSREALRNFLQHRNFRVTED